MTSFGSHVTSDGKKVINPSTANSGTENGAVARTTRSKESPDTRAITEQHHAEGRHQQADHQIQDHHHAEVATIIPTLAR